VGSEPGRLAASLGRAGAARPSPPASPSALPGPSTRTSGATTTTHRGRAQPRTAATPPVRQPRAAACSVPTAQPPATGAPHAGLACLVGQRASAAATALTQPGRVRRRNPTDQRATSVASPASSRPRPVDRAAPRRGRHGTSTRSRGAGCLAAPIWSPTPPPEVGGEGRVRTDGGGHLRAGRWIGGHHTAGRWTGGHLTAGPPDPGRRTQVTGHRTGLDTGRAAHQTAGQPDPDDGTGWVDTAYWTRTGDRRHGWHPGIADHGEDARPLAAGWRLRRADAVWASNNPGQLSSKDHSERPGHGRDRQLQVLLRRPAGASAHCCRVLDLDGTSGGQWDYGKVRCAGLGWCGSADESVGRVPR
jgi:hypothetical protein